MPKAAHPLESRSATGPTSSSAIAIRVGDDRSRFSLRIDPPRLERASDAFGCPLPTRIGSVGEADGRIAMCLGPDEWLLHAPPDRSDAVTSAFAALYADCPHSLTEISDREVGIVVEGAGAAAAINTACPRDLDRLPPGTVTRTVFDGVTIVLIREARTRFRIEVSRSYAAFVWDVLALAIAADAAEQA